MQDTATVTICRCGWVGASPNYGVASTAYSEHKAENPNEHHDPRKVFGVSHPIEADAIKEFKRIASVECANGRALDFLEKYKAPDQPRIHVKRMWFNIIGRLYDFAFGSLADMHYGGEQ